MAEGLLGMGFDETMGLAGGLMSAGGGRGFAAGIAGMQEAKQNAMKQRLIEAQLSNYASEIEARKLKTVQDQRQQLRDDQFFGIMPTGSPPGAGSTLSGGAEMTQPGTQVGAQPQAGGGFTAKALSERYGIPVDAILAEYRQDGGKKLGEWIHEKTKPKWENVNGNLVNTNAQGFAGGLQDGVSVSADGKANMWKQDGKGGLVFGAPAGALDTYKAYKNVDAGGKPIEVYNPATGRKELTTELNVINAANGQQGAPAQQSSGGLPKNYLDAIIATESGGNPNAVSPKGARGVMQVMPGTNASPGFGVAPARDNSEQERSRVGRDYLTAMNGKYQDPTLAAIAYNMGPDRTDKWLASGGNPNMLPAETKAYVSSVMTRQAVGGHQERQQSGNMAAGPSAAETIANDAAKAKAVGTAQADVVRDTGQQKENKLYGQLTAGLDRAIELLKAGPTASGAGAMMDSAANFFGKSTKGADLASQLDTISGWLTSNVPRMEGPQSDKDVANYRIMAAEVGDRTKPTSQRLAAAMELQGLQAKYAALNGGKSTNGATGDFGDATAKPVISGKILDAMPTANGGNKGQRIRDTTTGKIVVSNGLQWKAE